MHYPPWRGLFLEILYVVRRPYFLYIVMRTIGMGERGVLICRLPQSFDRGPRIPLETGHLL